MRMVWPVTNDAAGLASQTAAAATSSGNPHSPSGVSRRTRSCQSADCRLAPRRANPARRDAVDAHLWREAQRQTAREAHYGPLHGGEEFATIARHAGLGLIPSDGDDRTAAPLLHSGAQIACQPHCGLQVHGQKRVEFVVERPLRCGTASACRPRHCRRGCRAHPVLPRPRSQGGRTCVSSRRSAETNRSAASTSPGGHAG